MRALLTSGPLVGRLLLALPAGLAGARAARRGRRRRGHVDPASGIVTAAAYDGMTGAELDRLVEIADCFERPVLTLAGFYAVEPESPIDLWPVSR